MGSPSELTLDYKPNLPHHSLLHKALDDHPDQAKKLEDFVARLEEERLKIDAFKRELPLCMLLLNNAMETYKQQLEACQAGHATRPVLEEFMPMKENDADTNGVGPNGSEKAAWMVSEKLWKQKQDEDGGNKANEDRKEGGNRMFNMIPKLGGAFHPFSKERGKAMADLALVSSEKDVNEKKMNEGVVDGGNVGLTGARRDPAPACDQVKCPAGGSQPEGQAAAVTTQAHRKARRCWSPDLHRRFVNALQMLGGSQVATPKQIRELMKVDGLTNDEVKSHLQKYRLHTRRPIPPPAATASTAPPQVVVLGGIWVPPEYAASAYGAHPGAAAHYCTTGPVPQEFYAAAAAAPHHLRHHVQPSPVAVHHRGVITPYRGVRGSPEMDGKGGERSESIEDGEEGAGEDEDEEDDRRSDGWKGVGEKVSAKEREEAGEESNGSDVTLKF